MGPVKLLEPKHTAVPDCLFTERNEIKESLCFNRDIMSHMGHAGVSYSRGYDGQNLTQQYAVFSAL